MQVIYKFERIAGAEQAGFVEAVLIEQALPLPEHRFGRIAGAGIVGLAGGK